MDVKYTLSIETIIQAVMQHYVQYKRYDVLILCMPIVLGGTQDSEVPGSISSRSKNDI